MKQQYYNQFSVEELQKVLTQSDNFKFKKYTGKKGREPFLFEIRQGNFSNGVMCAGETMVISGKEKSGKSYYYNMFVSAHLSPTGIYENVVSRMHPDKHIIVLDTEMIKDGFDKRTDGMLHGIGLSESPRNLHAYSVKWIGSPVLKLQFLASILEKYKDWIGLVVLDKWQDFLGSMSNEDQISGLISYLGELQAKYNFAMIWTIHQNKNDTQMNGMSGGRAAREAAHVIKLTKESEDEGSDILVKSDGKFVRHGEYISEYRINVRMEDGVKKAYVVQDMLGGIINRY